MKRKLKELLAKKASDSSPEALSRGTEEKEAKRGKKAPARKVEEEDEVEAAPARRRHVESTKPKMLKSVNGKPKLGFQGRCLLNPEGEKLGR